MTNLRSDSCFNDGRITLAVGRGLCFITMLFASGDVWPVVKLGFTFRFAQLTILVAAGLLLGYRQYNIRSFPGLPWLYAFTLWVALTLPFSLFFERTLAYLVWTVTDVLMITTFVQYFRTEQQFHQLMRWFFITFICISIFGLLQFALGLKGINVLVTQWWIKGRLPRINGLSYEPSYYATYLIPGWILSSYLVERKLASRYGRLTIVALITSTLALLLCSSRMGWLMMFLWVLFRVAVAGYRRLSSGLIAMKSLWKAVTIPVIAAVMLAGVVHYRSQVESGITASAFLLNGIGLAGESAHSSSGRIHRLEATWRAFEAHPIIGTGLGALPVAIARQLGGGVLSIKEAKEFEGMSIFAEVFGSTGIVGVLLMLGFALRVVFRYASVRRQASAGDKVVLTGIAWAVIWILMILQFNQNFLRIYLFVDLAVLICGLLALPGASSDTAECMTEAKTGTECA